MVGLVGLVGLVGRRRYGFGGGHL
ncbi:hypothetical protein ACF1HA_18435 [Streptomyces gardneri]